MPKRRRETGPEQAIVELVLARDRGRCVMCTWRIEHGERGRDWQVHHRRPRGMGGTRRDGTNFPANLLVLCESCHAHVEKHRAWARLHGYLVWQSQDPRDVPIEIDDRWYRLTDAGERVPVDAPQEAGDAA